MWHGVWDQRRVASNPFTQSLIKLVLVNTRSATTHKSCVIPSKTLVWTFQGFLLERSVCPLNSKRNTWKFTCEVYTRRAAVTLLCCVSSRDEATLKCYTVPPPPPHPQHIEDSVTQCPFFFCLSESLEHVLRLLYRILSEVLFLPWLIVSAGVHRKWFSNNPFNSIEFGWPTILLLCPLFKCPSVVFPAAGHYCLKQCNLGSHDNRSVLREPVFQYVLKQLSPTPQAFV